MNSETRSTPCETVFDRVRQRSEGGDAGMGDCPIIVYVALDADAEKLHDFHCHVCGQPMDEHPVELSKLVPPGRAYRVNPNIAGELDLDG